jgi:hypothetical protein
VNPAQNTDHELIYQRAAVSQPSMQNDVSMAPISTRAQYTADPRSQSNGTLPMNIIKADVHTCMLEIAAIFGCVTVN